MTATGLAYGCGQCMPCRFNKRRIWAHRIMLEAAQYDANAFITLTYSDEFLPPGGSLVPSDTRDFLKRLRARVAPSRFRYFLVGEYGDTSFRPHYHAALFGFRSCEYGQSQYSARRTKCCYWCELVREAWGKGNVLLGTLEESSAGYMAGYVTKKLTRPDDPILKGRHPEFGRMSLKPGLGFSAMWDIADALLRYELDASQPDVPESLRHGMKALPLGRYLRRHLRKMVGKDEKASQAAIDKMVFEMLPMRLSARSDKVDPSLKSHLINAGSGRAAGLLARQKIYKQRRSL